MIRLFWFQSLIAFIVLEFFFRRWSNPLIPFQVFNIRHVAFEIFMIVHTFTETYQAAKFCSYNICTQLRHLKYEVYIKLFSIEVFNPTVIQDLENCLALRFDSFLIGARLLATLLNLLQNEENICDISFTSFVSSHWTSE